ncbi:hypothetical protein GUJ93_ZPchr0005g14913 [Zizania palustris]|uniref:G-patch domain-containing protein n=1 Tax=Zizania palustris TaxID=103762 RepID=A0A8J5TA43_ZIZPA|nr:hypothetical protein GUJ93_ZPchr0005g14913 [Zizania palustris]
MNGDRGGTGFDHDNARTVEEATSGVEVVHVVGERACRGGGTPPPSLETKSDAEGASSLDWVDSNARAGGAIGLANIGFQEGTGLGAKEQILSLPKDTLLYPGHNYRVLLKRSLPTILNGPTIRKHSRQLWKFNHHRDVKEMLEVRTMLS